VKIAQRDLVLFNEPLTAIAPARDRRWADAGNQLWQNVGCHRVTRLVSEYVLRDSWATVINRVLMWLMPLSFSFA